LKVKEQLVFSFSSLNTGLPGCKYRFIAKQGFRICPFGWFYDECILLHNAQHKK